MSNLSLIAGLGVAVVLSVAAFVARRRKKVSHDSMDLCLELVFFFAAYKLLKVAAVTLGMPSSYFYLAAFAVSAVALVYRMLRKSAGRLYNGLLLLACMGSAIGIIDGLGIRPLVYGVGERSSGAWLARVYHDKYAQEERLWQRHSRHGVGSSVYGICRKVLAAYA